MSKKYIYIIHSNNFNSLGYKKFYECLSLWHAVHKILKKTKCVSYIVYLRECLKVNDLQS